MPLYFHHLRFELYLDEPNSRELGAKHSLNQQQLQKQQQQEPVTNIFGDLSRLVPTSTTGFTQSQVPPTALESSDWRFGAVDLVSCDPCDDNQMSTSESSKSAVTAAPSLGPTFSGPGTSTKAACLPLGSSNTSIGWGVVHFYRDEEETPQLALSERAGEDEIDLSDLDCTTLCVPAVPTYMSAGDFLGFVGERWRGRILHCRLVMTSTMNRYLALLKFRDNRSAKEWKREFDGKVFNTMEPQLCHVAFVKTITFSYPTAIAKNDPAASSSSSSAAVSTSYKPFPPPTPNLIELPTCPVCLERMDETSGLMTIPCSHVFHCDCLQNWKGAGCPVCRFTSVSQGTISDPSNPYGQPFGSSVSNLCTICDTSEDLWICLICGYVGCGRYKGGHAKDHWKESAHTFALELETQYVWDYAGDMWVHRLIRDKGDGKVVELPSRNDRGGGGAQYDEDVVPRAKLENIGMEYTHLITSQLESQRAYYEDMIKKMVEKASKATAVADKTMAKATATAEELSIVTEKFQLLQTETVPQMERDLEREKNKATKGENLARNLGKSLQEEKKLNEGLMKRIEHLGADSETTKKQMAELQREVAELKEMNHDLTMFISGQEKLKEMERQGQLEQGEVESGSASVPEKKTRKRGKK